jgi:hypothetical protein
MINPYQNRDESNNSVAIAEKTMRYAACLFTSAGAFVYAKDLAGQYLPLGWGWTPTIATACGILAAILMAYLTDMMFGTLLQRVAYDLLASNHPNIRQWQSRDYFGKMRSAESVFFIVVLALLLGFDMYTTLAIRDPVANQARQTCEINIDSLRTTIEAANRDKIAALETRRKEHADAISGVSKATLNSNYGRTLRDMSQNGNGWAENKLSQTISSKTSTDRKALGNIETSIASVRTENEKYLADQIAAAQAKNATVQSLNGQNKTVMQGMYLAFTVIPKILAIILRVLMVITFLAYSRNFNPDLTGDGTIDYEDVEAYYQERKNKTSTGSFR